MARSQLFRNEQGVAAGATATWIMALSALYGASKTFALMVENMDQKAAIAMRTGAAITADNNAATRKITTVTQVNRNGCLKFEATSAGLGGADAPIAQSLQVDATPGPDVFVDQTTAINSAGANDVTPYPATENVTDYFTIAHTSKFGSCKINTGTGATVGTVAWEYWNGTAWTALSGVADGTNHFRNTGVQTVTFTVPTDWAPRSLNGGALLYHIRATVTVVFTVNPLITQGFITAATYGNNLTLEITAAVNQAFSVTDSGAGAFKINLRCGADGVPNQSAAEVMVAIANATTGDAVSLRNAMNITVADGSDGSAQMALKAGSTTNVMTATAFGGGTVATATSTGQVHTAPSINGPWSANIASTDLDAIAANTNKQTFVVDKAVVAVRVQIVNGGTQTWLAASLNV